MDNVSNITAIVLLLAANGFYVAAEFALVKARGFRIEALADGGSSAARLTVRIQANLESYLAACQLGITMASLGLGWVGEPAVAAILEPLFTRLGLPDSMIHTTAVYRWLLNIFCLTYCHWRASSENTGNTKSRTGFTLGGLSLTFFLSNGLATYPATQHSHKCHIGFI